MLVLARTASVGYMAGISTVLGVLLARALTLTAALTTVLLSMELPVDMRFGWQIGGLILVAWLSWRVWSTPPADKKVCANQTALNQGQEIFKGMIVGISSPYSLFLMFALLPTMVAPVGLGTDKIVILSAVVLLATTIPLVATIWAGVALHQVWSRHSKLFARTGAIIMLGSGCFGFLNFT